MIDIRIIVSQLNKDYELDVKLSTERKRFSSKVFYHLHYKGKTILYTNSKKELLAFLSGFSLIIDNANL